MNRLLHSNLTRLRKNKVFLIGMAFMFAASCALILKQYEQLKIYGIPQSLESTFFKYAALIGAVSAVFCSLFLGVEYSDGAMRNKIIVGHKRTSVYFANLISNILASLFMCLSYILPSILFGIPLIGFSSPNISEFLQLTAGSIVTVTALCSIFTMIGMLIQNKAIAPVICILIVFLSMGVITEVQRMLNQPEYYEDGTLNPNYLTGETREKYEFLYNALPAGQEIQYAGMKTDNINDMCLYAAGITIITTGAGIFFFRRKDIK